MLWTKQSTTKTGQQTEALATQYLVDNGLSFKVNNFHSRLGEIDIIMLDNTCLVFVEVKYRKNNTFGGAISAISYKKQQKIKQCAAFYLQQCNLNEYNTEIRFDVIAIQGNIDNPQITWLKNAF